MHVKAACALLFALMLVFSCTLLPRAGAQQRGLATGATTAPPGAGQYYALVIGNNAYTMLPKLKTAEADAREVERLLREGYGFQTKLLINATRGQVVAALSAYRRELGPDANLLIYYAGHGYNDKDAEKDYWLPVDAARDDTTNWIIADEITTGIKVIPARHVLVVSDSCYSGTLTRGIGEMLPRPTEREQFLKRMAAGRSRTLMASGGDEPVADSGGGVHSVFASALLRGLREIDKPQFTAAELFRGFIEESVAGRAQQTPEYNPLRNSGHESGDFVFVKAGDQTVEATVRANPTPSTATPATIELSFWESIKNSVDPEDFKAYLRQYPSGAFAALANNKLRALTAVHPTGARPVAGSEAAGTGQFATPQAAVETFFKAAAARDLELLSQCFAPDAPREWAGIREKRLSKEELDDLAGFVAGARVTGVQMSVEPDKAVVAVEFKARGEQLYMRKTAGGWKIIDF